MFNEEKDISECISEMQEMVKNKHEDLIIESIINIYKGVYKDYEDYYREIMDINKQIDEANARFNCTTTIEYGVKIQVLPRRIFDVIIKLKELKSNE